MEDPRRYVIPPEDIEGMYAFGWTHDRLAFYWGAPGSEEGPHILPDEAHACYLKRRNSEFLPPPDLQSRMHVDMRPANIPHLKFVWQFSHEGSDCSGSRDYWCARWIIGDDLLPEPDPRVFSFAFLEAAMGAARRDAAEQWVRVKAEG